MAVLETGVSRNEWSTGSYRHRESSNRVRRTEETGNRSSIQSPAVPTEPVARSGTLDEDHRFQSRGRQFNQRADKRSVRT